MGTDFGSTWQVTRRTQWPRDQRQVELRRLFNNYSCLNLFTGEIRMVGMSGDIPTNTADFSLSQATLLYVIMHKLVSMSASNAWRHCTSVSISIIACPSSKAKSVSPIVVHCLTMTRLNDTDGKAITTGPSLAEVMRNALVEDGLQTDLQE